MDLPTGVMRPFFKRSGEIAASSSVEAEFSDLKNRCFKGQLPIRHPAFEFFGCKNHAGF